MRTQIMIIILAFICLPCSVGFSQIKALTGGGEPSLIPCQEAAQGFEGVQPSQNFTNRGAGTSHHFLLDGKKGRAGIEVRIKGELAAVTDKEGKFTLPADLPERALLEFAVAGTVFFTTSAQSFKGGSQPLSLPVCAGELYGTVTDQDGALPGALVIVTNGKNYAFDLTSSAGVYAIHGAPVGKVLVIALAELHHSEVNVIHLQPKIPSTLDLILKKAHGLGKLYGKVTSPGMGGLEGAYVSFTLPGLLVRQDLTNPYGMYELEDIPVGLGYLYAHKDGFHDLDSAYFLSPGVNHLNLELMPVDLGAVVGQVLNLQGEPVAGALVRLTSHDAGGGLDWRFTFTCPQGGFAFGEVLPGPYVVQSFMPGFHPGVAAGTVFEGAVSGETLNMWLTANTGTVEGWVVDFNGDAVPYAFAHLSYLGFENQVSGWTLADKKGHFFVEDVPFGPYAVQVESAAFLPDQAWPDILPSGEDDFFMILYPFDPAHTGALLGTVYDMKGDPVPGAVVGCQALGEEDYSYKTITDGQGCYCFPLLPPEVYGVQALHDEAGMGSSIEQVFTGQSTLLDLTLQ